MKVYDKIDTVFLMESKRIPLELIRNFQLLQSPYHFCLDLWNTYGKTLALEKPHKNIGMWYVFYVLNCDYKNVIKYLKNNLKNYPTRDMTYEDAEAICNVYGINAEDYVNKSQLAKIQRNIINMIPDDVLEYCESLRDFYHSADVLDEDAFKQCYPNKTFLEADTISPIALLNIAYAWSGKDMEDLAKNFVSIFY